LLDGDQIKQRNRASKFDEQVHIAARPGLIAGHGAEQGDGARVGYASPQEALAAKPEEFVYVAGLHTGTGVEEPDFLSVVDVNPQSDRYSQIVHRTPMPNIGDELHHYGWQVCSSACHSNLQRANLVVPGFRSSRIHIVDVAGNPRNNWLRVAKKLALIVTACEFTRDALLRAGMGVPIHVVPVPIGKPYFAVPDWHSGQRVVLDCPCYLLPVAGPPRPSALATEPPGSPLARTRIAR